MGRPAVTVFGHVENINVAIFLDIIKVVVLQDGATHSALPFHTTLRDVDRILRC